MNSKVFLGVLKRFIASRGKPFENFSENGTSFDGANNELRKIVRDVFRGNKVLIQNYVAKEGIKGNFNPPSASHFGGLWQVGVKSLKYLLKSVIGNTILTHGEFLMLVTQIEAVLNSRQFSVSSL